MKTNNIFLSVGNLPTQTNNRRWKMTHTAINKNHRVILSDTTKWLYTITIQTFDSEGYIDCGLSYTLLETSNLHNAIDMYEKIVELNNLKKVY